MLKYTDVNGDAFSADELDEGLGDVKDELQEFYDAAAPGELHGLRYFYNGMNIYRIPIRHFTDEQIASGTYGKYGVVRNNTYVLTLEEITSFGRPGVPGAEQRRGRSVSTKSGFAPGDTGFETDALTVTTIVRK
jgi:hypothetical protein